MSLEKTTQLLKLHLSAHDLSDEQRKLIAESAQVVEYESGQSVHSLDSPLDGLLLLLTGEVELSVTAPDGSSQAIQFLGRDDQLGLLSLHQTEPFPVEVKAVQPTTAIFIPKSDAVQLLQDLPLWRRCLMQHLGPRLRNVLAHEKRRRRPRVVTFLHTNDRYREVTLLLIQRLTSLGERVGVMSDHDLTLSTTTVETAALLRNDGVEQDPDKLRAEASNWSTTDRLVIDVNINRDMSFLAELVESGDAVYCVCDDSTTAQAIDRMKDLSERLPNAKRKANLIRVLDRAQRVAATTAPLDELFREDFKVHWRDLTNTKVSTKSAGIERVLHHLRGFSLGLALGGGAARGMAHLGVLQVFEELDLPLDRLSGTSAGALIGIPYAAGYSATWLTQAFETDLKPNKYYDMLPYGDTWYMLGKYRQGGWDEMLRKYLENWTLEQLTLPVTSVAADLVSATEVRRCRGDATLSLLESINLPVMSRPICRDGMVLVDGGVLNVVPANVLVEQGASLVVAVDVSAKIRFEFAGNTSGMATEDMKVPNATQTAIRVRTVQDRNIRSLGTRSADLVIEPDVSKVELSDFQHASDIALQGRRAMEAALPQLKRLLHDADPELFPT